MFSKILIANRGEIAVRIERTCRELGVATVAVHSDVDARARHVALADEAVALPGVAPADTYLHVERVIAAAVATGAEAVHPGYGFLAENADFADSVLAAGLVWIGPPPDAARAIGDKIRARNVAAHAGVPIVPGILEPLGGPDEVRDFAAEHGYPVAVKAAGGGGGRGLRVARSAHEVDDAYHGVVREARAYFGGVDVYVERYLDDPKHLEVQLLAPSPAEALWLGVRDCSFQRRHQKLIEETPPPLFAERAGDMGAAAVAMSVACGYENAGTVEMLVDERGDFYFLEVNARLQVEHTVTEEVLGIDLVACQLMIAAGDPLGLTQDDLFERGHSIECRINAEDPARGFIPTPGRITTYVEPQGPGIRVDSGYVAGDEIPGAYDSLVAKVVVWAPDREQARARMLRALDEMTIEGVSTTIPAHLVLLEDESFRTGRHTTTTVERGGLLDGLLELPEAARDEADVLLVGGRPVTLWSPAMAASASAAVHAVAGAGDVVAPMQGTILKVLVAEGERVDAGDGIAVLEAMKMETTIAAPRAGTVTELRVAGGEPITAGAVVAVVAD